MGKDKDGVNFVTDDNTGGYFVCECQSCGEVFNSKSCNGGESIADTGDYGDCYCPHCGEVDPMECDNPALVWNVQQKKINELLAALEGLLSDMSLRAKLDGDVDSDGCVVLNCGNGVLHAANRAIAKAKGVSDE